MSGSLKKWFNETALLILKGRSEPHEEYPLGYEVPSPAAMEEMRQHLHKNEPKL